MLHDVMGVLRERLGGPRVAEEFGGPHPAAWDLHTITSLWYP